MVDLSHLGGLNPVEPLDLSNYAANKESKFQLPPKGEYVLQAPSEFPAAAFSRTQAGSLQVQIDPTIVGPTHEGRTVRFVKVSAKVFPRSGQNASVVGDYLAACGFRGTLDNEQEIAEAVSATAGSVYRANLDWTAYNKKTGLSLNGMERFPKLADGTYQSWIDDPADQVEDPNNPGQTRAKRVFANLTIPFGGFIPAE